MGVGRDWSPCYKSRNTYSYQKLEEAKDSPLHHHKDKLTLISEFWFPNYERRVCYYFKPLSLW
jgi:hypothetical protein